jgi:predicted TIM-barrel fold metal-dependent hydrolase
MLTRRKFIGTTLGAGAALATGVQGALPQGTKKRMIVDAQVHLWKANSPDFPWDPGVKPQLPEPFTIERALKLMDETGIDRVVIVPPGLNDINTYALEGAKPLQDPKSAARLPKWREQPGMLGVRVTFNNPTHIGWLTDGTANWFWPEAEKAGLPVMFLAFGRVNMFEPIAKRHPGLPLIIDHLGVNAAVAKAGKTEEAIGHAVALAKYPNVSIKMSNLPNASLEPYPFKDLTPHLKRVFDAYGPQRCHWGTDATNGMARVNWRQRLTHFTETIDFMSESDKDWVLGRSIMQRLKWA